MEKLLALTTMSESMRKDLEGHFSLLEVKGIDDLSGWLTRNGAGIRYVLTDGHLGVPKPILDQLPDLKMISSNGVGYDGIDTDAITARGILATHTPNVLNAEVATTALMLMLACYRNLLANEAHARSGRWQSDGSLPLSRSADNRTVGILGMGRIGQAIAGKLQPFNAEILYTTRSPKDVPYTYVADVVDLARRSDVLICIVPGGESTRHLVNTEVMDAIGPDGILINVARGSVVDEPALITALQTGRLGAAGLDVFENEPSIPQELCDMPNTVLLPHVGSATLETRAAMGKLATDNLVHHLANGNGITPVPECC